MFRGGILKLFDMYPFLNFMFGVFFWVIGLSIHLISGDFYLIIELSIGYCSFLSLGKGLGGSLVF